MLNIEKEDNAIKKTSNVDYVVHQSVFSKIATYLKSQDSNNI